jgi:hypothetical protein
MVENQRLYASIGYEETGRGTGAGYDRVLMRKLLRIASTPCALRHCDLRRILAFAAANPTRYQTTRVFRSNQHRVVPVADYK